MLAIQKAFPRRTCCPFSKLFTDSAYYAEWRRQILNWFLFLKIICALSSWRLSNGVLDGTSIAECRVAAQRRMNSRIPLLPARKQHLLNGGGGGLNAICILQFRPKKIHCVSTTDSVGTSRELTKLWTTQFTVRIFFFCCWAEIAQSLLKRSHSLDIKRKKNSEVPALERSPKSNATWVTWANTLEFRQAGISAPFRPRS